MARKYRALGGDLSMPLPPPGWARNVELHTRRCLAFMDKAATKTAKAKAATKRAASAAAEKARKKKKKRRLLE